MAAMSHLAVGIRSADENPARPARFRQRRAMAKLDRVRAEYDPSTVCSTAGWGRIPMASDSGLLHDDADTPFGKFFSPEMALPACRGGVAAWPPGRDGVAFDDAASIVDEPSADRERLRDSGDGMQVRAHRHARGHRDVGWRVRLARQRHPPLAAAPAGPARWKRRATRQPAVVRMLRRPLVDDQRVHRLGRNWVP